MERGAERILKPKFLPESLWHKKSSVLHLPKMLADTYIHLVDKYGLRELGLSRSSNGPVGGISKEDTDKHFAQSFDGSSARALLALLDPTREAGSTSNTLVRCLAGGNLNLTDAPCGAGAAAYTFLTAIAQLRKESILPRMPLYVQLVGAEVSHYAREYAKEIFFSINAWLEEQAIFVDASFLSWDATCSLSTADLVTECIKKSSTEGYKLLVVANFNGFLESNGKKKEAQPQLEELFRYASGKNSFAVWIEPNMNAATKPGGLFSSVKQWFSSVWKKIGWIDVESDDPMYVANAHFQLPLSPSAAARVSLAVMPLVLDRNK